MEIQCYTDGGCKPNPNGTAGWSFCCWSEEMEPLEPLTRQGWFCRATTNEAELMALAMLAWFLRGKKGHAISIHMDSMYTLSSQTHWVKRWRTQSTNPRQWTNAVGETPSNGVLINSVFLLLEKVRENNKVRLFHVKGHSGNYWNELCDRMATQAREQRLVTLVGYEKAGAVALGRKLFIK